MDADYNARITPWKIDESNFSSLKTLEEKAKFLLGYAILAPSGHNTQPWRFGLLEDGILVYADYSRRLPVANPDDRELVMSVATAITNFRVAAAHFGLTCDVTYLPEPGKDDVLTRAKLGEGQPDAQMAELFDGIMKRRTNRAAFDAKKLSRADLDALSPHATLGSAGALIVIDESEKEKFADIVSQGDLRRMADKAFTMELSEWIRPNRSTDADGMLAASLGIPSLVAGIAPFIVRTFNSSKSQAKKESAAVRESAAVVVLHGDDGKASLLETGELLERLLLKCAMRDIQYSFFNLPVELDDLRAKIKALAGITDEPQLLLRIGYGEPNTISTPRRPVKDVLAS
ncbi:MAG: Acg family FMN-binding oxidoreductase [Candidatus Geothermincolia bacterium]